MNVTLFQLAYQLSKAGRKAEARRLLEHILRVDPTQEQAWLLYADCLDAWAERVQALEACTRLNPNAWSAMANLAALQHTRQQEEDPSGLFPWARVADVEFQMPAFLSLPDADDLPPGLVTGSLAGKLPMDLPAEAPAAGERPAEAESLADTQPLRPPLGRSLPAEPTPPPGGGPFTTGDADLPELLFSSGPLEAGELPGPAEPPGAPGPLLEEALARRLDWFGQDPGGLSREDPFQPQDLSWAKEAWQEEAEPGAVDELPQPEPGLPVTGVMAANAGGVGSPWWLGAAAGEDPRPPAPGAAPAAPRPGPALAAREEGDPWMRLVRDSLTAGDEAGRRAPARQGQRRAQAPTGAIGSDQSTRSLLIALIILVTFMILTVMVLIGALLVRGL